MRHRRYGLVKITDIAKADEDVTVTMDVDGAAKKFSLKALLDNKIISEE